MSEFSTWTDWQKQLSNRTIMVSADFAERPVKKLVLFDVDGTLSPARQVIQHPDDYHA
jgi:hypothetical protein